MPCVISKLKGMLYQLKESPMRSTTLAAFILVTLPTQLMIINVHGAHLLSQNVCIRLEIKPWMLIIGLRS